MTFRNRKEYLRHLKTRPVSLKSKKNWKREYLDAELGKKFDIIRPNFPLADDAKFEDWKITFERYFPFLRKNVILIGYSLGGTFLAKYLSENKFPKKILSVYLVCPPFDDTCFEEPLVGGFKLKSSLSLLEKNSNDLTLFFSEDDYDMPIAHAEKYRKKLPNAKIVIFKSKNGHFRVAKFPEIVKMIKEDLKSIK